MRFVGIRIAICRQGILVDNYWRSADWRIVYFARVPGFRASDCGGTPIEFTLVVFGLLDCGAGLG